MSRSTPFQEQEDQAQPVQMTETEQLQVPSSLSHAYVRQEPLVLSGVPVKRRHGWWYYLIVVLLFLLIIGGASVLGYKSYDTYMGWYTASMQRAYLTGKNAGVQQEKVLAFAAGIAQGRMQQQREDAVLLQHTKAIDAKITLQTKLRAYQSGKQDEAYAQRVWFFAHCRYDSVIAAYICAGSP